MTGPAAATRLERRYRRLLALYPGDHRREHAEEMLGVLLAAEAWPHPGRAGRLGRLARHAADGADLVAGAARIRARQAQSRLRRARPVRDPRWSDALAVVSVVAPLLLLVAALAEVNIPQAAASSVTGHPHWLRASALGAGDLPVAAGALVAALAFSRARRTAGVSALAAAAGQAAAGAWRPGRSFGGYANPALAFTILLAGTAAAALLLSPGPDRGVALLTRPGTALTGACALILGGFSAGGQAWLGTAPGAGRAGGLTLFRSEVAGLSGDLLIAAVLIVVAACCLRAPVSRRVLALLAIPVIPYVALWQEKLAADLAGAPRAGPPAPLLYLLPLFLAALIVTGTRLARWRAARPRGAARA